MSETKTSIVKNYRLAAGLKPIEVANHLKLSRQSYYNMETNDNFPDVYIPLIAEYFNINKNILRKQLKPNDIPSNVIDYYITQNDIKCATLADKLNVTQNYISNWRHGVNTPYKYVDQLRNLLNIPTPIIFPDIVIWEDSRIILEFESSLLILLKTHSLETTPFNIRQYKNYLRVNIDTVIVAYTSDDIMPLADLPDGCISNYPKVIEKNILNSEDTHIQIEFENQYIIIGNLHEYDPPATKHCIKASNKETAIYDIKKMEGKRYFQKRLI